MLLGAIRFLGHKNGDLYGRNYHQSLMTDVTYTNDDDHIAIGLLLTDAIGTRIKAARGGGKL